MAKTYRYDDFEGIHVWTMICGSLGVIAVLSEIGAAERQLRLPEHGIAHTVPLYGTSTNVFFDSRTVFNHLDLTLCT